MGPTESPELDASYTPDDLGVGGGLGDGFDSRPARSGPALVPPPMPGSEDLSPIGASSPEELMLDQDVFGGRSRATVEGWDLRHWKSLAGAQTSDGNLWDSSKWGSSP